MMEHPIEGLMATTMDSIRDMIDVNTIIGEAIQINESVSIIPISKVCFGFASGGSEFKGESIEGYKKIEDEENISYRNPFGGGSGAGVSIKPVAFLVVQENKVKLLPIEHNCTIDKLLDYMPELCEKAEKMKQEITPQKETEKETKKKKEKKEKKEKKIKKEKRYNKTKEE